ncbi:MAG: hypothetical protein EZS28_000526 [Streblomastix strix]|uniref:EF-hand domain-containing protein n=1 Tax=Streblomastix strix TaxID=222440 RepID=A0A5J4XAX3_9EUKA|nr:MAG: hypothetical protein EZS28_000526 [Streblomastix strix]
METNEPDVKRCGRDQQLFAMNLMMELSSDSMVRLKTEFQSREIQMADFIMLMEEYLPNMYFDENCIRNLVNLFEEIDVNGDGGMEWDEFTQFIIESAFTVQSGNCGQKIYNFIADVQMTDRISFMSYSPITRRLYCAEEHTNNVIIINPTNGTHISTITGHTGTVTSCVYIPQWRVLATASLDQTIALWDEDSGFCICFQTSALEKEDPHVQMVLYWDQNHEMLFSGGINGRINIFTITNNEKWKIVNSGILPEDKVLLKKRLDVLRSVQMSQTLTKRTLNQSMEKLENIGNKNKEEDKEKEEQDPDDDELSS